MVVESFMRHCIRNTIVFLLVIRDQDDMSVMRMLVGLIIQDIVLRIEG